MKSAREIRISAIALFNRLPVPNLAPSSARNYCSTLGRMIAEGKVEPLRAGDARDTYNGRRAALHAGTWMLLDRYLKAFEQAVEDDDEPAARIAIDNLSRLLELCEPAIDRDPPMDRNQSSFANPTSRWTEAPGAKPRRGKGSKKHALKDLPDDWAEHVWRVAERENWKYLDALAVHMVSPARPADFVPGERDGQLVEGVDVRLDGTVLVITITPVKSHGGKFGTGETKIRIDPRKGNSAVRHLCWLCRQNGGSVVISLKGTNGMRKALATLGRRALGDGVVVTGYLFRHQYIADMKATVGAGTAVAAVAGHCTDRTQSRYGRVEHGQRRPEFISVSTKRVPKAGNIARASMLKLRSAAIGLVR